MDDIFKQMSIDELWDYKPEEAPKKEKKGEIEEDPKVYVKKVMSVHFKKRIASEIALEEQLDWHFERGASYHCISFGDIDSLSYLRFALKQQKIEYGALSTWCMALTDIAEIEKWYDNGLIKRFDFYVGEIFTGTYATEFKELKRVAEKMGGRVCVFRNHSKVMCLFGERFNFTIESSANINTNPRCENTVITVDDELTHFYKEFFDQIKAFNKDFPNWKPYELKRSIEND